jgi:hypothetical protein
LNCLVPPGATVAVAGLTLGGDAGEAVSVKVAVPRTACVVASEAVSITVCWDAMLIGAVYSPLAVMLPSAGLSVHMTLDPEGRYSTENCWVLEGTTVAVVGFTQVGGLTLTVGAGAGATGMGDGLDSLEGDEGGSEAPLEGSGAGITGAGDGLNDPLDGKGTPTVIAGSSKIIALAVLVASATLVAEIVTKVSAPTGPRA